VTWEEIEAGCEPGDFTVFNVPERVARLGDLWRPVLGSRGRFNLNKLGNTSPRADV
jgi:bifunctional non-homologous end joining protein LigD